MKIKPTPVSSFKFKSLTASNELCNITVTVFDNGITYIIKRVLSKDADKKIGLRIVGSKFGYNVFEEHYAIKFSSLMLIASTVAEIVKEEKLTNLL